jgi:hypothetical protein
VVLLLALVLGRSQTHGKVTEEAQRLVEQNWHQINHR